MDNDFFESKLQSLEWIIHRVLKEKGFTNRHNDYDDYAQELRIALFNELKRLAESNIEVTNLTGYIQQALRWKLKKLLRSASKNCSFLTDESYMLEQPFIEDGYVETEWTLNLPESLSPKERLLFNYLYSGYSVTQIATMMKLNARTIRRWRDQLKKRFMR